MSEDKNKMRIYDLVRNLVPDGLPEKELKHLRTEKTKKILEICKELGVKASTASSSLDKESISKVMICLDKGISQTSSHGADLSRPEDLKDDAQKKQRVVRRIIGRVEIAEPEITELVEPEKTESSEVALESEILDLGNKDVDYGKQTELSDKTYELEKTKEHEEEAIDEKLLKEDMNEPARSSVSVLEREEIIEEKISSPVSLEIKEVEEIKVVEEKPSSAESLAAKETNNKIQEAEGIKKEVKETKTEPYRVARPVNLQLGGFRKKPPRKTPQQKQQKIFRQRTGSKLLDGALDRPEIITVSHSLTVSELAERLVVPETEIIRFLFLKGFMKTINQSLEKELIEEVAQSFNCEVIWQSQTEEHAEGLSERLRTLTDAHKNEDDLKLRPPVVTIMGHVDHGKTTLLDAIRKSKKQITDTESGGITQHIGAYQVKVSDYEGKKREITFLDTPGHEAFTALRARGAQVTDIAILVVSADDGVMPQTLEAISHARAAKVPIVIAVNKIDKPEANQDKVLGQLAEHGLIVEDYGGEVVCAKVSAKKRINLDDLLSKITLVADIELGEKLMANPKALAVGAVVEASLSANRGAIATLLVQSGTLKKGDAIVAGSASGRVRAIFDDEGKEIDEAPPSSPVQILGLDGQPQAGDTFEVVKNVQEAKSKATAVKEKRKISSIGSLESFSSAVREGSAKELPVIIKADVHGSAEAVASELNKLSTDEVRVNIIHCAAGAVTESDINLAATTGAVIVNFNSIVEASSSRLASENNVSIYTYNIIYALTDAIRKALGGLLEAERIEIKHGEAEVKEVFQIGKNKIAGCIVRNGKLVAGSVAKIRRNNKELVTLSLTSLKRFKENAKEVLQGFECGIALESFNNFEQGDVIESWGIEIRERQL